MASVLMLLLVFATLAVLVGGVLMMAFGGKLNEKYANKMMVARVTLQGLALLTLALIGIFAAK